MSEIEPRPTNADCRPQPGACRGVSSVLVSRVNRTLILLVLLLALPVSRAVASGGQEASFQDNRLLLSDPGHLSKTLQTLKVLGVDRLVISVDWNAIAPGGRRKPRHFDGSNPAGYPAANWARYDEIAQMAPAYGMGVNFVLMGGAPTWALGSGVPSASVATTWRPSAAEFGAFVHAVGERYSGHYTPKGTSGALPDVTYWSLWNEPNVGASSLSPQTVNGIEVGPSLYRSLVDAGWKSLLATGHRPSSNTILVGQLASTGHADPGFRLGMEPLRFVRALYCVDTGYRPLRGRAAALRGCPSTASSSRRFRSDHPALFQATGWGHHPYHLTEAPNVPSPRAFADWVTFADLPKLERALDRAQGAYGSGKRFPLYLTEYGFDTKPPQPVNAVSPAVQAVYLNQAEYMAWRDPRVRTLSQYLLQDVPLRGAGDVFSAFASGLIFSNGAKKPSFYAYRLPIWMPAMSGRHGQSLAVWGDVRPAKLYSHTAAAVHTAGAVQIQFQRGSRGPFKTVKTVAITNAEGYFDVGVRFPSSGTVRLAWIYPDGTGTIFSRHVAIVVR